MGDSDEQMKDDFEYSRKVYLDLIETGQVALSNMLDVADETAHPRSYEVLSGLIKSIADVNDRLMDIHKKRKDITKKDPPSHSLALPNSTTNNIMITTSTAELQKMLTKLDNEDGNIIDGN